MVTASSPASAAATKPSRSRSSSSLASQLDTQMEMIVQLKQIYAHLMTQQAHLLTQLATANQLVTSLLGAVDGTRLHPLP